MDYTSAELPKWQPLWQTFPNDGGGVFKELMPRLLVDAEAIKNRPTQSDPLGGTPRLRAGWRFDHQNYQMLLRLVLDGEWSPELTAQALETWVCVQWPHVFRRA